MYNKRASGCRRRTLCALGSRVEFQFAMGGERELVMGEDDGFNDFLDIWGDKAAIAGVPLIDG